MILIPIQVLFTIPDFSDTGSLIISRWRSTPTSFSTTSEEKLSTGRGSLEGDGGEEEEKLLFLSRKFNFSAAGVCLWWGGFSQCGDIPLLMSKNIDIIIQESEND